MRKWFDRFNSAINSQKQSLSPRSECLRGKNWRKALATSSALFALSACASYQHRIQDARKDLINGTPSQAAAKLAPLAMEKGDDRLVYLLDYATALQQAGRYKESAKAFQDAETLADVQDYHSLSNIGTSLVLSEGMIQYKGDDYEKVLINAVNAVNYLELGDLDGALVEVRRLNNKLYRYKFEAKRDYEQNPFAFYLSAVIWEADKKWDDAYIAYKHAYDLMPNFQPLREDLIRMAIRADRSEDLLRWKKKWPEVKIKSEWKDPKMGELIFVLQQGWGPRKYPRPENHRFPRLYPVRSQTQSARLVVDGISSGMTDSVFDVEAVAIKTLEDDYGRLIATRMAGIATKAILADQLRQKNEALGAVAWIAMNLADRADLRQWSTLPQSFQIVRTHLKPGKYKVEALGLDERGIETVDRMQEREVEIKAGQKAFVSWRSLR